MLISAVITILSLLYKVIDAAGNAEFALQKVGLSERVAGFLGSARVIDVCVGLSLLALVLSLLYYLNRADQQQSMAADLTTAGEFEFEGELTEVRDRKFANQKVPLDGYNYLGCEFTNPTFVYNGTGRFGLSHNTIRGAIVLSTNNRAVAGAYTIAKMFGSIGKPMQLIDRDLNPIQTVEDVKIVQPAPEGSKRKKKTRL